MRVRMQSAQQFNCRRYLAGTYSQTRVPSVDLNPRTAKPYDVQHQQQLPC